MKPVLRMIACLAIIGLVGLAGYPLLQASPEAPAGVQLRRSQGATFSSLPPVNLAASRSILERSPFSKDRTAFDRETASTPPRPPADVKLTGISRLGDQLRASVTIDGQAFSVLKGAQTPVGVVSAIEETAVVIEGATSLRVEMSP